MRCGLCFCQAARQLSGDDLALLLKALKAPRLQRSPAEAAASEGQDFDKLTDSRVAKVEPRAVHEKLRSL